MAASSSSVFFLLLLSVFAFLDVSNAVRKPVKIYELKKGDFSVKLTNWGATVVSVVLPDSKGKLADVALGFDSVASYVNDTTYFGAIVGRVANRIGGAKFTINGKVYKLFANDGNNTLHGGHRGFSKVIWSVTDEKFGDSPSITFTYHSFDGEQGFPGAVDVSVTYKLAADYEMSIYMKAKSLNKPTPVNLASHTYWNLAGQNTGDILSNTIQIFSSHITPVDNALIPTGEILSVKGTAYDFLKAREIGSKINQLPNGYDINYVLDASPPNDKGLRKAAVLKDSKSGRKMELWTNQPGMQLYTSHGLKDVKGKGGFVYGPSAAVCLETQGFPDSVNQPTFPNQILNPGKVYEHYMLHKFSF